MEWFTDEQMAGFQRAYDEGRREYEEKVKAGLVIPPEDRPKKCEERGIKVIRCGGSDE